MADLSPFLGADGLICVDVQISPGPGREGTMYETATYAAPAAAAAFLRVLADDVERLGKNSTEEKR